jgi:hypothetical protein
MVGETIKLTSFQDGLIMVSASVIGHDLPIGIHTPYTIPILFSFIRISIDLKFYLRQKPLNIRWLIFDIKIDVIY